MNAKKLGFERNIHKLVYKHGSASPEDRGHLQATVSPRGKPYFHGASELADANSASELACRHMMTSQFRSGRRKEPFGKPNGEKAGDFERFLLLQSVKADWGYFLTLNFFEVS